MVGIVIVTHGNFGVEILNSAEMIIGNQENVCAISFMPGESFEDLIGKVRIAIEEMKKNEGILVFVDIYGGSPFNSVLRLIDEYGLQCIAGLNLPILIEALLSRDCMDLEQLKDRCLTQCMESIKDINCVLKQS